MSFSVTLQLNKSPSNKVDKNITDVAVATGVLRAGTSIISPVIEISSQLSESIISGVNYAYIPEFNRYYFVTNIISTANRLWVIHMQVDVLMTYKTYIRRQTAIVSRQKNVFNMMLDDGWFMAYQNPIVQLRKFSEAAPFNSQEYILVLAGNNSTIPE